MADTPKQTIGFNPNPSGEDKTAIAGQTAHNADQDKTQKEDLTQPYEDKSSVTIALVENYSLFRKVNRVSLPKRVDYIGSCIESSRRLSANKIEAEKYFPQVIGIMPNHENFLTRVKQYLNNIRIAVDEQGVTFDTTFVYDHKSDYYEIKAKLDEIERRYSLVNRNNSAELRKALQEKINAIDAVEREKAKVGYPLKVEDYLMYRHCLLYSDVAKDMAFINGEQNIRFYIKDNKKEEERKRKQHELANKAISNYVVLLGDESLFNAVYVQYCVISAKPILNSLLKDRMDKEVELRQFASDYPDKFNKIYFNRDIRTIADIELLIARGELIRHDYNQNIITSDGELIGQNMTDALAWFKNPENISAVNAYKAKLKNF